MPILNQYIPLRLSYDRQPRPASSEVRQRQSYPHLVHQSIRRQLRDQELRQAVVGDDKFLFEVQGLKTKPTHLR
jgi:hypothetical protein